MTTTSRCRFSRRISFCGGNCSIVGQRAKRCGVARAAVEDRVLDRIERGAMLIAEAHANGVRAAVGNQRIGGRHRRRESRSRPRETSVGRKAEAGGDNGIDLEVGCRAADGVFDAVLHVDHAWNLADGIADPRAKLRQQRRIVGEDLDLDRLGRVGQVADHVLQHLGELDVQLRLGGLDLRAHVGHHVVDGAAALGFQLDGEVAGVGLGHGGQAHLQAGAARGAFHLRASRAECARRVRARGWSRSASCRRA